MDAASVDIVPLEQIHWPPVRRIYVQGIESGFATFETRVPEWHDWHASHLHRCRLVARRNDRVVGWAALSPVSERVVYGGVAEVSVYVDRDFQGQGIGSKLLRRLVKESEAAGVWTLQAGVFRNNVASLQLHRRAGFRVVGVRDRLGKLNGVWRDVILLERRSDRVGLD